MSKILTQPIGVFHHADEAYDNSRDQSNIVPSVFHIILIPLALSIGSVPAALVYFALAIGAYSTIFRAKSYYVFAIVKVAIALISLASAWFSFLYAAGTIGHML